MVELTQEQLVKKAIDIMIHGKIYNNYNWAKVLDDKGLWFWASGSLCSFNVASVVVEGDHVFFDKNVKNMALLKVLLKDWCIKDDNILYYKRWIKQGTFK